ncbi:MAG TPA: long-chain fatty acid--CoA ligase, partial [Oculatellaceae cyanobacterium]
MSSKAFSKSLHGLLEETAHSHPQKTALIFGNQTLCYARLDEVANQFANMLLEYGVRKGDRVALYMPNGAAFVVAFFGVLKAGGVVSAISSLYREREVEVQLADSGAKVIVTLGSLESTVAKTKTQTPLRHIIAVSVDDFIFSGLISGCSNQKPALTVTAEDLAALQYTGGTTGTPKAAMLTHHNLTANANQFAETIKATTDDVFLTALPLFHIYGLTTSLTVPIKVGAKMVFLPKFEPQKALEAIQRHKVTVFCGVPTMYQLLLGQPDLGMHDLTSVRVCISGASALPPQVQKQFMAVSGGFLAEGYGLTEASPVTHCNPVDKGQLHVGSIGLPLPDTEARIVDLETGTRVLGVGEVGELMVKGPQVMLGYWRRPEETALVLHDGWLLTGDIARKEQDGYYYIVDRKKDLIKHNGFSIYPRELEDVFYEHPTVKLCTVVAKPDSRTGEVPKAYVVLKEATEATCEELLAFVNGKVASYKEIRDLEFRNELPVSG